MVNNRRAGCSTWNILHAHATVPLDFHIIRHQHTGNRLEAVLFVSRESRGEDGEGRSPGEGKRWKKQGGNKVVAKRSRCVNDGNAGIVILAIGQKRLDPSVLARLIKSGSLPLDRSLQVNAEKSWRWVSKICLKMKLQGETTVTHKFVHDYLKSYAN